MALTVPPEAFRRRDDLLRDASWKVVRRVVASANNRPRGITGTDNALNRQGLSGVGSEARDALEALPSRQRSRGARTLAVRQGFEPWVQVLARTTV